MEQVVVLFEAREELYKDLTQQILQTLPHLSEGITLVIEQMSDMLQAGAFVTISDVRLHGTDSIWVAGVVQFAPGKYVLSGEEVTISEDTQQYFTSIFQYLVPFGIIELGSAEAIAEYLEDWVTVNADNEQAAVAEMMAIIEDNCLPTDVADDEIGFDLDALSDEQRAALELYNKTNKTSK